jgi:hypothetical protein
MGDLHVERVYVRPSVTFHNMVCIFYGERLVGRSCVSHFMSKYKIFHLPCKSI